MYNGMQRHRMPCNAPPLVKAWIKTMIEQTKEIKPQSPANATHISSASSELTSQRVQALDRIDRDPYSSESHKAIDSRQVGTSHQCVVRTNGGLPAFSPPRGYD